MTTDVGEGEERGGLTVYMVGHSNRDLDEFAGLLKKHEHGVETLAAKPHPYTSAAKVVSNKLSYRG
jgi:hypothetical protein